MVDNPRLITLLSAIIFTLQQSVASYSDAISKKPRFERTFDIQPYVNNILNGFESCTLHWRYLSNSRSSSTVSNLTLFQQEIFPDLPISWLDWKNDQTLVLNIFPANKVMSQQVIGVPSRHHSRCDIIIFLSTISNFAYTNRNESGLKYIEQLIQWRWREKITLLLIPSTEAEQENLKLKEQITLFLRRNENSFPVYFFSENEISAWCPTCFEEPKSKREGSLPNYGEWTTLPATNAGEAGEPVTFNTATTPTMNCYSVAVVVPTKINPTDYLAIGGARACFGELRKVYNKCRANAEYVAVDTLANFFNFTPAHFTTAEIHGHNHEFEEINSRIYARGVYTVGNSNYKSIVFVQQTSSNAFVYCMHPSQRKQGNFQMNWLIEPFDSTTWIMILIFYIALPIAARFGLWNSIRNLLRQNLPLSPRQTKFLIILSLSGITTFSSYEGSIMAKSILQSPPTSVDSMRSLILDYKYKIIHAIPSLANCGSKESPIPDFIHGLFKQLELKNKINSSGYFFSGPNPQIRQLLANSTFGGDKTTLPVAIEGLELFLKRECIILENSASANYNNGHNGFGDLDASSCHCFAIRIPDWTTAPKSFLWLFHNNFNNEFNTKFHQYFEQGLLQHWYDLRDHWQRFEYLQGRPRKYALQLELHNNGKLYMITNSNKEPKSLGTSSAMFAIFKIYGVLIGFSWLLFIGGIMWRKLFPTKVGFPICKM